MLNRAQEDLSPHAGGAGLAGEWRFEWAEEVSGC